jgi:hypothetical protein
MDKEFFFGLTLDQTFGAIGAIGVITGAVWVLITLVYKRIFIGARLTITFEKDKRDSGSDGILYTTVEQKVIQKYIQHYAYKLTITNNSEISAYQPKLHFEKGRKSLTE